MLDQDRLKREEGRLSGGRPSLICTSGIQVWWGAFGCPFLLVLEGVQNTSNNPQDWFAAFALNPRHVDRLFVFVFLQ